MNIRLYYTPGTRADRVRWLLEELEQPYELVNVDLFGGEGESEEYRRIHPLGCVPAVSIDGRVMFESAAICQWLADRFPEKGLAPDVNAPERMPYLQWLQYVSATLEPQAWNQVLHGKLLPESLRVPEIVPWSRERFAQALSVIDRELDGKEYLLGDRFSTVDILLTNLLGWVPGQLKPHGHCLAYMKRVKQREKYQACH